MIPTFTALMLAVVVAAPSGAVELPNVSDTPSPAMKPLDPFKDLRGTLAEFEVTEGIYTGAIRHTPRGGINWYFANQALLLLVDDFPEKAKAHLDAYLRNVGLREGAGYTVPDFEDAQFQRPRQPDSHDAYAGTLLSLAAAYVRRTGDYDWLRYQRDMLKAVARANITEQIKGKESAIPGLVRVFQKGSKHLNTGEPLPDTGYLMDNCEAYAGLRDFAEVLDRIGDAHGPFFREVSMEIAAGIHALYLEEVGAYRWADYAPDMPGEAWYPDLMSQVFPDLLRVEGLDPEVAAQRAERAWDYVMNAQPEWYTVDDEDHPQLTIGYYTLVRGKDSHMAHWSFENWEKRPARPGAPHGFTNIADLGWAVAIRQMLSNRR